MSSIRDVVRHLECDKLLSSLQPCESTFVEIHQDCSVVLPNEGGTRWDGMAQNGSGLQIH